MQSNTVVMIHCGVLFHLKRSPIQHHCLLSQRVKSPPLGSGVMMLFTNLIPAVIDVTVHLPQTSVILIDLAFQSFPDVPKHVCQDATHPARQKLLLGHISKPSLESAFAVVGPRPCIKNHHGDSPECFRRFADVSTLIVLLQVSIDFLQSNEFGCCCINHPNSIEQESRPRTLKILCTNTAVVPHS